MQQRLAILERLVEWWHGPQPAPQPTGQALPDTTPAPLRWWYQRYGWESHLCRGQNTLRRPDELEFDDGALVLYDENQWVYSWAVLPEDEDPPVWIRENGVGDWEEEGSLLSEFLIGVMLLEAVMPARHGASACWLDTRQFESITGAMLPVPITEWTWPVRPHRFYVRENVVLFGGHNRVDKGKQKWEMFVGARNSASLDFLRGVEGVSWDREPD